MSHLHKPLHIRIVGFDADDLPCFMEERERQENITLSDLSTMLVQTVMSHQKIMRIKIDIALSSNISAV